MSIRLEPIVKVLPTPIAVPLSEHGASDSSLLKLWTAIDVVEMTMGNQNVIGFGFSRLDGRCGILVEKWIEQNAVLV